MPYGRFDSVADLIGHGPDTSDEVPVIRLAGPRQDWMGELMPWTYWCKERARVCLTDINDRIVTLL